MSAIFFYSCRWFGNLTLFFLSSKTLPQGRIESKLSAKKYNVIFFVTYLRTRYETIKKASRNTAGRLFT